MNGITGITVGIDDPQLGHMVKSYGTADDAGTPLTTEMHYRIASVSKTFTALAVLKLVDEKKLSLDAPIAQYVDGLPHGDQINVRELLAMRGGVWDFTSDPAFIARYEADPTLPGWTPDGTLALVRQHAADFKPPNRKSVYSNSEYILLGYVIEKVTGQAADRHFRSLLSQLGLTHSSFPTGLDLPGPFVHGYLANGSQPPPKPTPDASRSNPQVPWTAGAMISTVPDMLTYAKQLGTGVGLTSQTAKLRQTWGPLTTTGPKLQYGLGVTQLGEWIGHDGSIFGYSDLVFYLPAKDVSVVAMVNVADGDAVPAQAVWGQIVNRLYPGTITRWP